MNLLNLEGKLNSYEPAPVSVHTRNRTFLRIFEHLPEGGELDFHEAVEIPVGAETRDSLAFRGDVGGAGTARRQPRMLTRPESQLLVAGGQLDRADAAAFDEIPFGYDAARGFFAGDN